MTMAKSGYCLIDNHVKSFYFHIDDITDIKGSIDMIVSGKKMYNSISIADLDKLFWFQSFSILYLTSPPQCFDWSIFVDRISLLLQTINLVSMACDCIGLCNLTMISFSIYHHCKLYCDMCNKQMFVISIAAFDHMLFWYLTSSHAPCPAPYTTAPKKAILNIEYSCR